MTRQIKNPEIQKSLDEFTQHMIASRLASKEATRHIYQAQTSIGSATASVDFAARELEKVGESAAAEALRNSTASLVREREYLDRLLDLISSE